MNATRRQLTLFVDDAHAKTIEECRRKYNPVQYGLIRSHVTLCREDEIGQLEHVLSNLMALKLEPISLQVGKVVRFSEGKGVFIYMKDHLGQFQQLREILLQEEGNNSPRKHEPHITLMHPRNSSCTDEIFDEIKAIEFPTQIQFSTVSLIEQEIGKEWKVLAEFDITEKQYPRS